MKEKVLVMTAVPEEVPKAADFIANYCVATGLAKKNCFEVKVVVAEALNNVIEHALQGGHKSKRIEILCNAAEEFITVTTIDDGISIDKMLPFEFPEYMHESGRGWPIIFNWMDNVEYCIEGGRNHLIMTKYLC